MNVDIMRSGNASVYRHESIYMQSQVKDMILVVFE